jgi:hypothetical protein
VSKHYFLHKSCVAVESVLATSAERADSLFNEIKLKNVRNRLSAVKIVSAVKVKNRVKGSRKQFYVREIKIRVNFLTAYESREVPFATECTKAGAN